MTITPGISYRDKKTNELFTVVGRCWVRQGDKHVGGVLYEPRVVGRLPARLDTYACTTDEFSEAFEPWSGTK
jgi:hypothetical protein